jgi:undecaprenyl-phosphate 4-deoxy-4-formamido-L-arabinose transferase
MVSIVIPVYCGEQSIGKLVELLLEETYFFEIEIILVNDDSPDGSEAICRELVRQYAGKVRLINLARNFGEHNAVLAGLQEAHGEVAVIMDDDLQHPPIEVGRLVTELINSGNDVVYGVYECKHHTIFRNFFSWLNGKMATVLLKKPSDLYLSSFKVLNRFVIDEIIKYSLPYPYIDGLIFRVTTRVGMLSVKHLPRTIGDSGYTVNKLLHLWLNMFTNFSVLPLRIAMLAGLITVGFGILFLGIVLYWYLTELHMPPGWTSIVGLICIFSGVQLLALGMLGEYMGRLFLGQNGTPQFVVRNRFE